MSEATAFNTLQQGADIANAGDTVLVMNGTYTNSVSGSFVMDIRKQGTSSGWIVFKNYPGHAPVIQLSANWAGISLSGAAYIIVDGFTVIGNNDNVSLAYVQSQQSNTNNPYTSGSGIVAQADANNRTKRPHHITIRNCTVKKCGGSGIGGNQADYITIEHNTVSECCWYSPFDGSAISLYQLWNSDAVIATKNFIIGNTCYYNRNYIPFFAVNAITDGNGIIIDDSRNTQNGSTLGAYNSSTYIANNLVFGNGGRGIHAFLSDNITAINNTVYANGQSPELTVTELSAINSGNISFINNISIPRAGLKPIGQYNTTNIVADHNLWATNATTADPYGTNTVVGDPRVVNPSTDALVADFHLQPGSIAAGAGTKTNAPATDHDGQPRIQYGSMDIGAFAAQHLLLPVASLTQWSAVSSGARNKLSWQYALDNELDSFRVEKSGDGLSFSSLATVKKNMGLSTAYQLMDDYPENGPNFYRLKVFSKGSVFYSAVIAVNRNSEQTVQATVSPNPVHSQMMVTIPFNAGSKTLLQVFDETGRLVFTQNITGPKTMISAANWPAGWYVIIILQGAEQRQQIRILKQ